MPAGPRPKTRSWLASALISAPASARAARCGACGCGFPRLRPQRAAPRSRGWPGASAASTAAASTSRPRFEPLVERLRAPRAPSRRARAGPRWRAGCRARPATRRAARSMRSRCWSRSPKSCGSSGCRRTRICRRARLARHARGGLARRLDARRPVRPAAGEAVGLGAAIATGSDLADQRGGRRGVHRLELGAAADQLARVAAAASRTAPAASGRRRPR